MSGPTRLINEAEAEAGPAGQPARARRWRLLAGPLFGLGVFGLALWALYSTLRNSNVDEIGAALATLPPQSLAAALACTALAYGVLTLYDRLGFRYIGQAVSWRRMALASCTGYAVGNISCNAMVAGAAVRYWIYGAAGIRAAQVGRVVVFCSASFWIGYLALGAPVFLLDPLPLPLRLTMSMNSTLPLPLPLATARPAGLLCLAIFILYLLVATRAGTLKILRWQLSLPPPRLALGQAAVGGLDVLTLSTVLWLLMPELPALSYPRFLQAFMLALVLGTATQVPGGLGVFESAFLLLLPAGAPVPRVAAALLAFRAIYYILPLLLASLLLAGRGASRHAALLGKGAGRLAQWSQAAVPQALSVLTFAAGAVLLLSGMLPASAGRMAALAQLETPAWIEAAHLLAGLAAGGLLLLAQGLQRRIDAAWTCAMALLAAGIVLALARGFAAEPAALLALAIAALAPSRVHFYRHAALMPGSGTGPGLAWNWLVPIILVLAAAAWLHGFSFRETGPWWQAAARFGLQEQGPRALRSLLAALLVTLLAAGAGSFARGRGAAIPGPAAGKAAGPGMAAPPALASLVAASSWSGAAIALRREHAWLAAPSGRAGLLYRQVGRSWIALGEPVGAAGEAAGLADQFRRLCERHGADPVFFDVPPEHLDRYLALGLACVKLGEEARVALPDFRLAGPDHAGLHQTCLRLARAGCRFELIAPERAPQEMAQLRQVAQAWLQSRAVRSRRPLHAGFDPAALAQFPVAAVRQGERIIAYATVWASGDRQELAVECMRHLPGQLHGASDFLLAQLMLWGRDQAYRWFNLGLAPLAGMEAGRDGTLHGTLHGTLSGPLAQRMGSLLYHEGEHFHDIHGLQRHRQKFGPVWRPRYLVLPAGAHHRSTVADVAALVAAGHTRLQAS